MSSRRLGTRERTRVTQRLGEAVDANGPGCARDPSHSSFPMARSACKRASLCDRARQDLRLSWPVILFRGLAARPGSLRQFQADSRAGSARDEKKPAVVMSNTSIDLQ